MPLDFLTRRTGARAAARLGGPLTNAFAGSWRAFRNRYVGPRADVGLSLGSGTVAVRMRDRMDVLDDGACLAVDRRDQKILAYGAEARRYDGRTSDDIRLLRPIRGGAVTDSVAARHLLQRALKGARLSMGQPHVVLGVSAALTAMERRNVAAAAKAAGAKQVHLVDQALLAALGAGLPVLEPDGSMVVDLGAGTAELAVLASGYVLAHGALKLGGDGMDDAIRDIVRKVHAVEISASSAERLKNELADATGRYQAELAVPGRDLRTGLPTKVTVTASDVREAILPLLQSVAEEVRRVLRELSPDLLADVSRLGAVLTGGVAQMRGLAPYLEAETGLRMQVAEDPAAASGRGLERVLRDHRLRRRILAPESRGQKSLAESSETRPQRGRLIALLLLAGSLLLTLFFARDIRNLQPTPVDDRLSGAMVPMWNLAGALPFGLATATQASSLNDDVLLARLKEAERRSDVLGTENQRLRKLYKAAPRPKGWQLAPLTMAPVVARSPKEWLNAMTLGAGSQQGLKQGMVVTSAEGLVGQLAYVTDGSSRVKLLTDPSMVVSAEIKKRKASGVLYGMGDGTYELRFLDPDTKLKEGDAVTTSGVDGLFPPGMSVGRVTRVSRLRDQLHQVAVVSPSVDFGELREVLILQKGGRK